MIGDSGRGDLTLARDGEQLVVIEAKMFSGLSAGTRNAPEYDQAARNVACIAEVLCRADRKPSAMSELAFYVVAPEAQIRRGIFGHLVTHDSIAAKVRARVGAYDDEKADWLRDWFLPVLERTDTALLSWEHLLTSAGPEYVEFYESCLRFNEPLSVGGPQR